MDTSETLYGCVFNIQHFSIHDGPGIRTTVFLKGCPLSCIWCHNPESRSGKPVLFFTESKCTFCSRFVKACPNGCHEITEQESGVVHIIDRSSCKKCGGCCAACFNGALEISGKIYDAESVIAEVMKDKVFYETSGGGVTFSGGEPFFQPEFLIRLLKLSKAKGLHTAIETCGFTKWEILREAALYTDLFLYDYKLSDPEAHKKYTGADNRLILSNLEALDSLGADIILRCPLIPGINTDKKHLESIAETANKYKNIREINLEPYHPLGISKSRGIGIEVKYDNEKFLDNDEAKSCLEYISSLTDKKTTLM